MSQWMGLINGRRTREFGQCLHWANKDTNTHKQTNKWAHTKPNHPQPPLHLGFCLLCHCFSPSFFVSSSTPICCVWTWPLGANSLPWTPSAVWLSTVNWAWLAVSGKDRAVLSPVQHAAFCHPASSFTGGSMHQWRGCDEKGVCQALALHLFDFQSLMTNSCLGAPRQNNLFGLNLFLLLEEKYLNVAARTF